MEITNQKEKIDKITRRILIVIYILEGILILCAATCFINSKISITVFLVISIVTIYVLLGIVLIIKIVAEILKEKIDKTK